MTSTQLFRSLGASVDVGIQGLGWFIDPAPRPWRPRPSRLAPTTSLSRYDDLRGSCCANAEGASLSARRTAKNWRTSPMRPWLALSFVSIVLALTGCGPTYVRGSQDPSVDNAAMSTGLDKDDIQRMLSENLNHLRTSPVMDIWRSHRSQDTVSIFPFINDTTEHLEPQLQAILGEAETWLVEANVVTMVSRERQNQMIAEVE